MIAAHVTIRHDVRIGPLLPVRWRVSGVASGLLWFSGADFANAGRGESYHDCCGLLSRGHDDQAA